MRFLICGIFALTLVACSSSETKPSQPAAAPSPTHSEAKPFPKGKKVIGPKCKYDTDCIVRNSCIKDHCQIGGEECRFRSDCRATGHCNASQTCEYY
jgi:hypothetical protein